MAAVPKQNTRIVRDIPLEPVFRLLDRRALFVKRWRLSGGQALSSRQRLEAESMLLNMRSESKRLGLWRPQAVYDYFQAEAGNGRLTIIGQISSLKRNHLEIKTDKLENVIPRSSGPFLIALQLVTIGPRFAAIMKKGALKETFLWHGLAAELTEALAKWCNGRIAQAAGWRRTVRISPGYPAWPELSEQRKVFALLKPAGIGVRLTRGLVMTPEYSTSAMVLRSR